jgi:SAM-dependent methyltransferase
MNEEERSPSSPEEPGDGRSPSSPASEEAGTGKRRKRAKLSLRIPDDEVARPATSAELSDRTEEIPAVAERIEAPALAPTPIISIGAPSSPSPASRRTVSDFPPAPPLASPPPAAIPAVAAAPSTVALVAAQTPAIAAPEPAGALPPEPAPAPQHPPTLSEDDGSVDVPVDEDLGDVPAPRDTEVALTGESVEAIDPEELAAVSSRPPPPQTERKPPSIPAAPPVPWAASGERPVPSKRRSSAPPPPDAPRPPMATSPETRVAKTTDSTRPPAPAILDDVEMQTEDADVIVEAEKLAPTPPRVASTPPAAAAPPPVPRRASRPDLGVASPASGSPAAAKPMVIVPPTARPSGPSPLAPPPVTEATATRRRGRPWWEELFGDDFLRATPKLTDEQIAREADFIEDSLGVAPGGMLLDLGCGTGLHAIELSRRRYQVVGFDLSLAMLARAGEEAQERGQKLNFVQGDMREMTFEETFDGVYSWNTSFGFFEEDKNAAVIGRVHRALRSGGQFLLDVVNRDFVANQSPSLVWFEGDGCICMDEMQVDWITSRMRVKRTMMLDDGRTKEIEYSIRIYALHELGKLLHDHGFRVAEVSGRIATPGVFFGPTSPRTIILAEKK